MWITTLASQEKHNYVGKFILQQFTKRMEFKIYLILIRQILKLPFMEKLCKNQTYFRALFTKFIFFLFILFTTLRFHLTN